MADYDLRLRTARPLTPEELERVIRAALDEAARICGISDDAPRTVRRFPIAAEPKKVKTA